MRVLLLDISEPSSTMIITKRNSIDKLRSCLPCVACQGLPLMLQIFCIKVHTTQSVVDIIAAPS